MAFKHTFSTVIDSEGRDDILYFPAKKTYTWGACVVAREFRGLFSILDADAPRAVIAAIEKHRQASLCSMEDEAKNA